MGVRKICETTDHSDQLLNFLAFVGEFSPEDNVVSIVEQFQKHCEFYKLIPPDNITVDYVRELIEAGIITITVYEDVTD